MLEGETLTGSLTPTALVQAAKQLPEDLLRPFAVASASGERLTVPAPLAAASFFLHPPDPSNYVPVNCPKKSATNCPQHDNFRTPLSPWWRSTMARNSSRGNDGATDAGLTYTWPWDLLGLLALCLVDHQRVTKAGSLPKSGPADRAQNRNPLLSTIAPAPSLSAIPRKIDWTAVVNRGMK